MARYVDLDDLAYLMTLIREDFVQKEPGKVLSSNDFTDYYKNLLDNISQGGISGGSGDKTAVFTQGIANSVWDISHNLGKFPSVTVVDSAGNQVVGDVIYRDFNNVTVIFSSAFSGKAYLN